MSSKEIKNKALTAIQLLTRLKNADDNGIAQCVTCGVKRHYKDRMHGGHYIPRGSTKWCLDQRNLAVQCAYCNCFGMKSGGVAAQAFTIYMIDQYGKDFVEEMIRTKSEPVKMYKADYQEILDELNDQIKDQRARIGEN